MFGWYGGDGGRPEAFLCSTLRGSGCARGGLAAERPARMQVRGRSDGSMWASRRRMARISRRRRARLGCSAGSFMSRRSSTSRARSRRVCRPMVYA